MCGDCVELLPSPSYTFDLTDMHPTVASLAECLRCVDRAASLLHKSVEKVFAWLWTKLHFRNGRVGVSTVQCYFMCV